MRAWVHRVHALVAQGIRRRALNTFYAAAHVSPLSRHSAWWCASGVPFRPLRVSLLVSLVITLHYVSPAGAARRAGARAATRRSTRRDGGRAPAHTYMAKNLASDRGDRRLSYYHNMHYTITHMRRTSTAGPARRRMNVSTTRAASATASVPRRGQRRMKALVSRGLGHVERVCQRGRWVLDGSKWRAVETAGMQART